MIVKIQGTVTALGQIKSGKSSSGIDWITQDVVVSNNDTPNNVICFTVFGPDLIDYYKVGQNIEVDCILNSREWNGKYYTSLLCKGKRINPQETQKQGYYQQEKAEAVTETEKTSTTTEDNLPF